MPKYNGSKPDWTTHKYRLPNGKRQDPMGDAHAMYNYSIKCFRDIARGQFNYMTSASNFQNPQFIESAIQAVNFEIQKSYEIYTSVSAMYNCATDSAASTIVQDAQKRNEAYRLILQTLFNIKATGDISYLQILSNKLPGYKFNI